MPKLIRPPKTGFGQVRSNYIRFIPTLILILAVPLAVSVWESAIAQQSQSSAIVEAVNFSARPMDDRSRDKNRKPKETLLFSGVKPGDVVGEFGAYSGYYTRILSRVVGKRGKILAYNPSEFIALRPELADAIEAITNDRAYQNVSAFTSPVRQLAFAEQLDVAWNTNNYHDMHWERVGGSSDVAKGINSAIFDALKPGGILLITDHSGQDGAGATAIELHRIDEKQLKSEILAAGFMLVDESPLLRNSADPRDVSIFAPEVRGKTDQFVLKFQKPK